MCSFSNKRASELSKIFQEREAEAEEEAAEEEAARTGR